MPTEQDIINQITAQITANGVQAITADVLRPLLIMLAEDTRNVTGDLENLETTAKGNLVAAVNEIFNIATQGAGVQISYGLGTPQATPPPVIGLGMFYAQVDGALNVLGFWQWNGLEWVEIKETGDKTFTHIQNLPNDTWEIAHFLNKKPSVSIIDSANQIVEGLVTYINDNNLIINFNSAFAGKAYLN